MKQLIVTLTVLLAFSTTANAQNAVIGTAPFKGVLLSIPQAGKIKQQLINCDLEKELQISNEATIAILNDKIGLMDKENGILMDQSAELNQKLEESTKWNTLKYIGFFILGAAVTVGASQIGK